MELLFDQANVHAFCKKYRLKDKVIILGFSGGPDSVYLFYHLYLLKSKGLIKGLIIVHCNHETNSYSTKYELFCYELAKRYTVKYISKKISDTTFSQKKYGSQEQRWREFRRSALESVANEYDNAIIALAHHYDDQQETFFIRMIRGTSLAGLTCMKEKEGLYVRPLLSITKQEILSFLHKNNIEYCIDETNNADSYLRNRVRKYVIPALKNADDRYENNFNHMLDSLQKADEYLREETEKFFDNISYKNNQNIIVLSLSGYVGVSKVIRHRVLIFWLCKEKVSFIPTQKFFNEIDRFCNNTKSNYHKLGVDWSIHKQNDGMWIKKEKKLFNRFKSDYP